MYYVQDYRIDWTPDGRRCDVAVRGEFKAMWLDGKWTAEIPAEVSARALQVRP